MPFQFSLRALLRLRQSYEQRERMRLSLLNAAYGRLRQEYEETVLHRRLGIEDLGNRLRDGMAGSELRLATDLLQRSADRQLQLKEQMKALEIQVRKQTETFLESQRKRKILESLRERELHAYELNQNRREQQRIDNLFVQRRRFQRGG
jgi:flagellar FliJ protein